MNAALMILLFAICGFIAMYISFAPVVKKYMQTLQFKIWMLPLWYVLTFYTVGSVAAYFLLDNHDFIEPLTFSRAILPIGLALIIYIASLIESRIGFMLTTVAAVGLAVWMQPIGDGSPFPKLDVNIVRCTIVVFGVIFCLLYRLMNSTTQAFAIPLLAILFGLIVLGIIGAIPMFSALCATILLGILMAFLNINYYGAKINMDCGSCAAVAFLVFYLLILQIGEFSFMSCAVLTGVFWAELLSALWYRYFVTHSGNLLENTCYYEAATKYSHHILAINIAKICTVNVFLAWFQLFSVNTFSMPLITLLIILWLNSSFGRSDKNEPKNLKEINQAFVKDLKQNIQAAKDALKISKEDK